jgi:hypothetical protein
LNIQQKSIPAQPHKFFERFLDNDLNKLSDNLIDRYEKIKLAEIRGVTPLSDNEIWKDSGSVSTMKWKQYNVFQFHIPEIHNLYRSISDMVKEACIYYGLDFEEEQFMIQGWFNINYSESGKLGWHEHGGEGAPDFHGYYCVKAEPSVTHYNIFGNLVDNVNKNNRAILSEMGHAHSMGDWNWDGPRITIAYDVIPLRDLIDCIDQEQHWIPLI